MPNPIQPIAKTASDHAKDKLNPPIPKEIRDLARALMHARDKPNQGRGRAIFLVGAGCSVSAGIKAARGVAQHCALHLARCYSQDRFTDSDPDAALRWLIEQGHVDRNIAHNEDGSFHWSALYSYFFENRLNAPNAQREVINEIIDNANDGINWAHACLGELVNQRYVHTVLTTNFDQLVLQAIIRTGLLPVTADGLDSLNRIWSTPRRPQVVHLHGSMHTYNLRNSKSALKEPGRNSTAVSMIHSLLQQCELLVVVGYGGGEEGVMELLINAVKALPQFVIYWVTYEQGHETLSQKARELLSGENKFSIWGGEADKFFGDLMEELRIGQPSWVADPISVLKNQSERLLLPAAELEDVRILIGAFKERVSYADRSEHRWPEKDKTRVQAAEKRTRGEFSEAQRLLEEMDLQNDLDAARMHALNQHSLFEQGADKGAGHLDSAISEFENLVNRSEGENRLQNILSLCDALNDKSEAEPQNSEGVLRRIVELVRNWLPHYLPNHNAVGNARLNLCLAQALQELGERTDDDRNLMDSETAYNGAIAGLADNADPRGLLIDAKSGLAAVLQVRGQKTNDPHMLRRAVALHREVQTSRGAEQSKEEAGPLENLAGSLVALAGCVDAGEKKDLLSEAKAVQERAIKIYERQGQQAEQAIFARDALATINAAISESEQDEGNSCQL